MTPRKRARVPRQGTAREGRQDTATPCRHSLMTANDDTPATGQDCTDDDRPAAFPLLEADDESLSDALIDGKQEAREAVNTVSRALLNEQHELRDEDVQRVAEAGDRLTALSRTLALRTVERD